MYIFALGIAPTTAVKLFDNITPNHIRKGQFLNAKAGSILDANQQGRSLDHLSNEMNITKQKAKKMFDVYEFMVDHNEDKPNRYSFYEVYLSNRLAKQKRGIESSLDKKIVKEIRSNQMTAQEFRKMLPLICKHRKQFNKFITGKNSLIGAYESLEEQGKTEDLVMKLRKIHDSLSELTKKDFDNLDAKAQQNAKYRVNKIITTLQNLRQKVYGIKP